VQAFRFTCSEKNQTRPSGVPDSVMIDDVTPAIRRVQYCAKLHKRRASLASFSVLACWAASAAHFLSFDSSAMPASKSSRLSLMYVAVPKRFKAADRPEDNVPIVGRGHGNMTVCGTVPSVTGGER